MQTTGTYRLYACGDQALTIELGNSIDETVNAKVQSLFRHLQVSRINGIKDIIPSYHTITVIYDALTLRAASQNGSAHEEAERLLLSHLEADTTEQNISRQIEIPVCYDIAFGPDLDLIATTHQVTREEVIALHTGKTYKVYLLGFLPGFAYMGSVDERIATPRKTSPRTAVPAGSVGIAGAQTGIYPFESPGGWQVIGRTPLVMFDVKKDQPALLQPGDEVRFRAVTKEEFNSIQHGHTRT